MTRFNAVHPLAARCGSFLAASGLHALLLLTLWRMPGPPPLRINLDLPVINLHRVTIGAPARESQAAPLPAPVREPEPLPETPPVPAPAPRAMPEPAPEPVPEPLPEPPPAPARVRTPPAPDSEAVLRAALQEARKQDAPDAGSILSEALDEARRDEVLLSGAHGDGIGYYGLYLESVVARIRPHFTTSPRSDNKVFDLVARLEIAGDGSITKVTVLRPSGDSAFDANVLRAIREAGKMEPPLNLEARQLEITFNSQLFWSR
jgi:TonB family protein